MCNININFNSLDSTSDLSWSLPADYTTNVFENTVILYHVVVQTHNGLLITNFNTTSTHHKLFNVDVCFIYNVTVTTFVENYTSAAFNTLEEFTGGILHVKCYMYLIYTIDCALDIVHFSLSILKNTAVINSNVKVKLSHILYCFISICLRFLVFLIYVIAF